ncbi:MAG: endonuclease/exonuclease/phosphatase family protein [Polyangiaceae bacterium]
MSPLRVMSYNVRYFGHGTRGLASTRTGIRRIAEGIADVGADLVCLQEVETQSVRSTLLGSSEHPRQIDMLMADLARVTEAAGTEPYVAHYFPAHAYRLTRATAIYTTGLAVLAKRSMRVVRHNADEPHDITHRARLKNLKQTRICAHVAFESEKGAFDVFNTHLSLPNVFAKAFWTEPLRLGYGKNQLEEAKQLAEFVGRVSLSPNYVIVGDFNSLPGSPVDTFLREERGLRSAFSHRAGDTFSTAGFLRLRMHIDHLYASPSVKWIDGDGTHGFDEPGRFAGLSDHVPLIARCVTD